MMMHTYILWMLCKSDVIYYDVYQHFGHGHTVLKVATVRGYRTSLTDKMLWWCMSDDEHAVYEWCKQQIEVLGLTCG